MSELVEINKLTKRFGALKAVDEVSFSVDRGSVLGFLGPNGAGKSTTMKMITGFLAPDSGSIRVGGDSVIDKPVATKRRIGYLPEGAPLYGDMTPQSFLGFVAEARGIAGAERANAVRKSVERLQIADVANRPIETLSKGYKRRVGLAQAIIHDPEVLVLDEPTDGLDPNQKVEVRSLIQSMAADKVIILSTHILEEVEAVCTRAIIIAAGRVVSDDTPQALAARSDRHNCVTVTVDGVSAQASVAALDTLDFVDSVQLNQQSDNRVELLVRPKNGDSIVEPLSSHMRDLSWMVQSLQVERGRLDDVFRDITAPLQAKS